MRKKIDGSGWGSTEVYAGAVGAPQHVLLVLATQLRQSGDLRRREGSYRGLAPPASLFHRNRK
jgi:hypothetical protein